MAEALSDAGAGVVLCSRKIEPLEEVRSEIEAGGGRALAVECDVTDPEDVERVVSQAEEAFGSLDIVVNNSGATWGAPPAEMPLERSEERRVGKECRARWSTYHYKKKEKCSMM